MKKLEQNESKGFPIGVGGWLLFFCVSLTIIGPLFSFGKVSLVIFSTLYNEVSK
jgi:hypothetical protein